MVTRMFDLNIERVLEHWTVAHAIREIIANALDEQALTGTEEPTIFKDKLGHWHIRDWGRGLRYQHLTQNENTEKLKHPQKVIGKFGVGLKDALAAFHRRGIKVTLASPHGSITLAQAQKHGFADVATLHANIDDSPATLVEVGTDIILIGVSDDDIEEAKGFFLRYSGDAVIEETTAGTVLRRTNQTARIYVNGLRIAEEPNFLFSYNITSTSAALRKALNRERTNVGRTAYTDRVKAILLACQGSEVADLLARDLTAFQIGTMHDELQWTDVSLHACRVLNATQRVVFFTPGELTLAAKFVDYAKNDGYRVVIVPENIRRKLPTLRDISGAPIRDLSLYQREWDEGHQYSFIPIDLLSPLERAVWDKTDAIFRLAGGRPVVVRELLISETMRLDRHGHDQARGIWESAEGRIIIRRSELRSLADYAGVLLHELTHARSKADDLSIAFENALSDCLGVVAANSIVAPSS